MQTKIGKAVADNLYIHTDALRILPEDLAGLVWEAQRLCLEARTIANVFKIDARNRVVSALTYLKFFDDPFPELAESWRVHIDAARVVYRSYADSLNPPILHRKELLLPPEHPRRAEYERLTEQAEQLGLFADTNLIGFKRTWDERLRHAGYSLDGHTFQPLGNDISDGSLETLANETAIQRHRTALSRDGLSAPMQALARHGLLSPEFTYFDYGCGRGDDLSALRANGLEATGWDPHFSPNTKKLESDIVNIGFVINVIEDFEERLDALRGAFSLASQLLVVSTMLYGNSSPAGRPFRDGFLTQRNTFQKYFTQAELKEFVETVLETEAVAVAPGIMFIFSNKDAEQRFLYGRQRSHHALRLLGYRRERAARSPRPPRESRTQELLAQHGVLIEALWDCMLSIGRVPHEDEFAQAGTCIEAFGSWGRALRFTQAAKDPAELALVTNQRRDDLIVYLALQLFSRRKPYRQLEIGLQRDIKAHFGDYQRAIAVAQQSLLDAASPTLIDNACQQAASCGLGYYIPSDYLQLHSALIERLPALLRIYIGCGALLYGDLDGVDLVKIHIRSGKLTLMKFDDFVGAPLPRMLERVKVRLRDQDIDFFLYGSSYEPPLLYFKSRYLSEDLPMYEEQLAFDEHLESLGLFDPASHGLPEADLVAGLQQRRLTIDGCSICGAQTLPSLDNLCGQNFTYRELIECGETWERTRIGNSPKQPDTYNALHALATKILDPVIDYFGMIKLTYGFAGPELTKKISGRIAPHIDQHAAHELNRQGKPICSRLGAAVDFLVEDEDMLEVAKWITKNTPFDRLYIYGRKRPIHVSYGPELMRQVTIMIPTGQSGKLIPKTFPLGDFARYEWTP